MWHIASGTLSVSSLRLDYHLKTFIYIYIYIYKYMGVPGGMCQISGGGSLC